MTYVSERYFSDCENWLSVLSDKSTRGRSRIAEGRGHKGIEAAKQPRIICARSAENLFDIYISQETLHLHILNTDSVAVLELLASNFHWDFI